MSPRKAQTTQPVENHYLAQPGSRAAQAVLGLHAWWGLNPFVKSDRAGAYVAQAAELAWSRTIKFFQEHLR